MTEEQDSRMPNPTNITHIDKLEGNSLGLNCGKEIKSAKSKQSIRSSFWGFFWNQKRKVAAPSRETHFNRFVSNQAASSVKDAESSCGGDLSVTSGVCETLEEEQIEVQPMHTIAERTETSDNLTVERSEKQSAT